MKTYKIEVWYRFTVNGEQEKEFETFEIVSDTLKRESKNSNN